MIRDVHVGNPYQSSGKHRVAQPRTTAQRVAAKEDDTDEREPTAAPTPEEQLRAVLDELPLNTPAQVATSKLLEEIAERSRGQGTQIQGMEEEITALRRAGNLWHRLGKFGLAILGSGVLSSLAYVAAQLIEHGDARAEARQNAALVLRHAEQIQDLGEQLEKIRLQSAADRTLLQICASRLGAQQGIQ